MIANQKKPKTKLNVIQDEEKPIERDVLAEAIVKISESMVKLQKSGLNEKAIICLVYDAMPSGRYGQGKIAGKPAIQAVFTALSELRAKYTR